MNGEGKEVRQGQGKGRAREASHLVPPRSGSSQPKFVLDPKGSGKRKNQKWKWWWKKDRPSG